MQTEKKNQKKVSNLFRQGKNYYAKGRLDKAENAFNQIVKIDSGNPAANKYLKEYIPAKRAKEAKAAQAGKSDYITIVREKTPLDFFNDAEHLVSQGEYLKALPIYNYAHDIARSDKLKRKIVLAKKRAEKMAKEKKIEAKQEAKEDKSQARIAKEKAEREDRQKEQAAQRAKQEKVNNLYHQAKVAYTKRELNSAENTFNQVLEIDPDHRGAKAYLKKIEIIREKRKQKQ